MSADLTAWLTARLDEYDRPDAFADITAKRLIISLALRNLIDDPANEEALYLLQLLALPYADRPGYRDEWRPA